MIVTAGCFVKNMNILDTSYHWKNRVHCIIAGQEQIAISKYVFLKKTSRSQETTFLHFMTSSFHNFTLKKKQLNYMN